MFKDSMGRDPCLDLFGPSSNAVIGDKIEDRATPAPEFGTLEALMLEFVALEKDKRDCDAKLKQIKDSRAAVHDELLTRMQEATVQSARVGGMTVFLKKGSFVNKVADKDGVSEEQIAKLLLEHGYGEECKVHLGYAAGSLKSMVVGAVETFRANAPAEDGSNPVTLFDVLPEDLAKCLKWGEFKEVHCTKG